AGREAAPQVAVYADAVLHTALQIHRRFFWQALLDGRQVTGGNQLIEPGGLVVFRQGLVDHDLVNGQRLHRAAAANGYFIGVRVWDRGFNSSLRRDRRGHDRERNHHHTGGDKERWQQYSTYSHCYFSYPKN